MERSNGVKKTQLSKFKYAIMGNSAAGISCAETIRQKDKRSGIAVISDEPHLAYARCLLPNYIEGSFKKEDLPIRSADFYKSSGIDLILGKKVVEISEKNKNLTLDDKTKIEFDNLLIATGASPTIPQIQGVDKDGVLGLRTIADAESILKLLPSVDTVVVLGGGLVGTKAAYYLGKIGKKVKIVVKSPHILSQMCDARSAGIMSKEMEKNKIEILTQTDIAEIQGKEKIKSVKLDNGKTIDCQLLIVAKGVRPNMDFLKDTSVKIDRGIVVDRKMQTNIPAIYAAGDCAQGYDLLSGKNQAHAMWPNAVKQARIAAKNMVGEETLFEGAVGLNSLEYYGVAMVSAGWFRVEGPEYEELVQGHSIRSAYKKILLKDNKIAGFILVGDIHNAGLYLSLLRQKTDVAAFKGEILDYSFNYATAMDYLKDEEKSPSAERFRTTKESLIHEIYYSRIGG
ncbi:MAG: FAD-dependent oxidoreductase [Candidatus Omnitrophota bacterium]